MYKKYLCAIIITIPFLGIFPLINLTTLCPLTTDKDQYLGFCGNTGYGDYEHAAFYLNLEPEVISSLKAADVIFAGNSKLQITFSAANLSQILKDNNISYYLLGFNAEGFEFPLKLIEKYNPQPKAMIINSDAFFYNGMTKEGEAIVHNSDAQMVAYLKKWSDNFRQSTLCPSNINAIQTIICSGNGGILRSRTTGIWNMVAISSTHTSFEPKEGAPDGGVDVMTENAKKFIAASKVNPECIILTVVPAPNSTPANSREVAKRLGIKFIYPEVANLKTMDCCHLDMESSRRWIDEFMKEALPILKNCASTVSAVEPQKP